MSAVYWVRVCGFAKPKWPCGSVIPTGGIMYKSADVGGSKLWNIPGNRQRHNNGIVTASNARNTNIITVLSDPSRVSRYFAQQASYIRYERLRGARRSSADQIKLRATCLITSHRDAGVFQTTLREKFTHTRFPSFQPARTVLHMSASKSETREFHSKTGFVFRKASVWANLVLTSVE